MGGAVGTDGPLRGDERLSNDLAAIDAGLRDLL